MDVDQTAHCSILCSCSGIKKCTSL